MANAILVANVDALDDDLKVVDNLCYQLIYKRLMAGII